MKGDINIIIPAYRDFLTDDELLSLRRCIKILAHYPITIVHPEGLTLNAYKREYESFIFESFPSHYFNGRKGYNHLMMSKDFYNRFTNFDFILIHQLDVFVFEDKIKEWCCKGYDYVGAPWLAQKKYSSFWYKKVFTPLRNIFHQIRSKPQKIDMQNIVGNGGFSLRRVESHLNVLNTNHQLINHFIENSIHSRYFEDKFWSIEAPKLNQQFRIPKWEEALYFSFDKYPELCYKKNHGRLPLAVHGFNKRKTRLFWKGIIEEYVKKSN